MSPAFHDYQTPVPRHSARANPACAKAHDPQKSGSSPKPRHPPQSAHSLCRYRHPPVGKATQNIPPFCPHRAPPHTAHRLSSVLYRPRYTTKSPRNRCFPKASYHSPPPKNQNLKNPYTARFAQYKHLMSHPSPKPTPPRACNNRPFPEVSQRQTHENPLNPYPHPNSCHPPNAPCHAETPPSRKYPPHSRQAAHSDFPPTTSPPAASNTSQKSGSKSHRPRLKSATEDFQAPKPYSDCTEYRMPCTYLFPRRPSTAIPM